MEVVFIVFFTLILLCNLLLYREFRKISDCKEVIEKVLTQSLKSSKDTLDQCSEFKSIIREMNRKIPPQPNQLPQSTMKPNNWDSVREAFKGPVRAEANERA
jgi:hypothetical protein